MVHIERAQTIVDMTLELGLCHLCISLECKEL